MPSLSKQEPKTERFEVRLTRSQKKLFAEAASIEGFSNVSEYVIHVTLTNSRRVIQQNETLSLSERDRITFFKAITGPPRPKATLKKSMKRFLKEQQR